MSVEQSAEQREIALIGKVEMRIALADTDAKLSNILATYLTPLLLKLASDHQSVRNKVIAICQHINTRVQPQSVQLPVKKLVDQFKTQDNSWIRHFDLLYIQQGVIRLPTREKIELLPVVSSGISKSGNHGPQIFYLLLRLLETFTLPPRGSKDDVELRANFEISDEDAAFLAAHIGKFILFTPQKGTGNTCPGLDADEYKFFRIRDDAWNPAAGGLNLNRTKVLTARLLASGLFNDKERFLPALFASADPGSSISDIGDDVLKRVLPVTDVEDPKLVHDLFDLYFGEHGTPRVRAPLRLKILNLLNKSTQSTRFATNITKLVEDGVASQQDGEDTVMSNAPTQGTSTGREATKLRGAIFSYISFVARYGNKDTLQAIAPTVVGRLQDFIDNQGWPKPGTSEDLISRGYAYEVIGLLARAGPKSLLVEEESPSMDLLRWLFESLARDSSGNSVTVSIEESLSTVLSAVARLKLSAEEHSVLAELLIFQMAQSADLEGNKRLRSTRYVAVRFANRCLPYSSVQARRIDVQAMGCVSDRPEVREEGERGLSPYWYRMLNGSNTVGQNAEIEFPDLENVVDVFYRVQTGITSSDPLTLARRSHELHASSFRHMTGFARRMLVQQALREAKISVNLDSDWERRLDAMAESDLPARIAIKNYYSVLGSTDSRALDIILCALFECTTSKTAFEENHLIEFLALSPEELVGKHAARCGELLPVLKLNNHTRRMTAAQAFGILASHPNARPGSQITQLLEIAQGWSSAIGTSLSSVHGAIIALGHYYSRLACRGQGHTEVDDYHDFLKTLFEVFVLSRDDLLREASYSAIGQMCLFGSLDIQTINKFSTIRTVADKLYERAKDGNDTAISGLGYLSMVLPEDCEDLRNIEEQLHKLHEIRQSEAHFTVGEAFSCLAAGWSSAALATKLDVKAGLGRPLSPDRTQALQKLVDRVLKDCANTKPALKKAAVMWLLCLVQFCGDQLQTRLSECQAAFRRCLSDRDELVQETASRGLGLVYEKGDRKLKDDLVRELVSSFSSDKQQLAGNVSADTQLFEPGALPTGDGSVSTYKDIMSLAAEVGDSSLVYKFMSMASSNAIWSSRAAFGRFGLSRVLSDSSVDGYLANNPKLYPKLFRYRFDPNGGVQRSMNDIWNALVPDSAATINQHFDGIMEDLLTSILGKEWRVRQACCAAIAELVQGRPLEKYEEYLERIWTQCFKVLDDIKESVRAAAASLARTLTGALTRALEADHSSTKNASAMLKHVLPFLLSPSGMESSAKDVQTFSVHTLLEIIKKANGATIRPFIAELVERLIGLLSSLEPEAVNYLHLNASKYNLTEQKIDDMRLSSVRSSPLMEAIERCLDLLDDDTMSKLWSKLEGAMKSAVGLPSKVGSSRVLVSLATRRMVLFRRYSDSALKLIEKLVIDRNDTVSSSYAIAAGYLTRGASDRQIERLIEFAQKLYFNSEGDRETATPRRSITAGEIMFAFSKHASDKFSSFATAALPFVFVAKHDTNDQVKEQFQETWNEAVGGTRAVQLYLNEILELCVMHLDSPQWTLKHTAARTVAETVMAVLSSEAEMSHKTGNALWPAVEKALAGKTWEGKEVVLSAFVKFVEVAKPYYMAQEDVRTSIIKIALREAKRQNASYRPYAVKALGNVAQARDDIDMSDSVFEAVEPLLTPDANDNAMDVDGGKDQARKAEELKDATVTAAIDALFASINPAVSNGPSLSKQLSRHVHVVAVLKPATAVLLRCTYNGILSTFGRLLKRERQVELGREVVHDLKSLLFGPVVSVEAIRLTRAEALVAIAKASPSSVESIEVEVRALIATEVSGLVRDRLLASLGPPP